MVISIRNWHGGDLATDLHLLTLNSVLKHPSTSQLSLMREQVQITVTFS